MKKNTNTLSRPTSVTKPKALSQKSLKSSMSPDAKQKPAKTSALKKKTSIINKKTLQNALIESPVPNSHDLDSSCESSIDSLNYVKETKNVKEKVLNSLKIFKNATEDYINVNNTFEKEVISFEKEVKNVKNEVDFLYLESNKSRDEIFKIKKGSKNYNNYKRNFLTAKNSPEMNSDEWISVRSYNTSPREIVDELKKEMLEIKEIIKKNEEEDKNLETENNENRKFAMQLKESFDGCALDSEAQRNNATCKTCALF